jgi:hypothetical protein
MLLKTELSRSAERGGSCRIFQTATPSGRPPVQSPSDAVRSDREIWPVAGNPDAVKRLAAGSCRSRCSADCVRAWRCSLRFSDQALHAELRAPQSIAQIRRPCQCARIVQLAREQLQFCRVHDEAAALISCEQRCRGGTDAIRPTASQARSSLIAEVWVCSQTARGNSRNVPAEQRTVVEDGILRRPIPRQSLGQRTHAQSHAAQLAKSRHFGVNHCSPLRRSP